MSHDDLHWLCNWGGVPLINWERLGFSQYVHNVHPCVVDHVEYWLWKENEHIFLNDCRDRVGLWPITEAEMYMLHKYVCEKRWRKCPRPF
ncbi:MAG: hypothetical protein EBR09_15740 [Proteobacteria bacterium]|jgi:hypothetical protein|nr:hypothetical protein [Pseudomonadota bacterium]